MFGPASHNSSTSAAARFRQGQRDLLAAQKPSNGVPAYLRWVNRRAGRFAASVAYTLRMTPNTLTAISATCSFTGLLLLILLPRTVWLGILVACILALGYVFDSADGQLARLYKQKSSAGEWIDHVVDAFRSPTIHAAVAAAVILKSPNEQWLAACALIYGVVTSGQFLSQILATALLQNAGRPLTRGGNLRSFLLQPTDMGTLCWCFALWGFHGAFAAVYGILMAIAIVHSTTSLKRRHRDLCLLDTLSRNGEYA